VSDRLDYFGVFFPAADTAFGSKNRRSFLFSYFRFFIFVQGIV